MVSTEIKDRIIEAANALYEQGGHDKLPTVDAVRREARVSMNDASIVVRDWKKGLMAKPVTLAADMPEEIKALGLQLMAGVWQQAQDLANKSLNDAVQAWESDKAEFEAMIAEISEAFEVVEVQLKESESIRQVAEEEKERMDEVVSGLEQNISSMESQLSEEKLKVRELEAECKRFEKSVVGLEQSLKSERDQSLADKAEAKAEIQKLEQRLVSRDEEHGTELKVLAGEHKKAVADLQDEIKRFVADLAKAESKADSIAERKAELEKQVAQLIGEINELNQKLGGSQADNKSLNSKLESCHLDLKQAKSDLDKIKSSK